MSNDKRSFFAIAESYIDMIINILSIYIAFFFSCLIDDPDDSLYPNSVQMVITILFTVIFISFIYQTSNIYKPAVFIKAAQSAISIIRANLAAFSIVTLIFMIIAKDGTRGFIAYWIVLAFLVSTAFLAFKRRLILHVLAILREKQYILRKVVIIGDNTAAARDYVNQIANNPNYGMMILG